MKLLRCCRALAVVLACAAWVSPCPIIRAAEPLGEISKGAPRNKLTVKNVLDIELGSSNSLSGQVVDAQGIPLAKAVIEIRRMDGEPVNTVSSEQGYFEFSEVRGGVYYVTAAGASQACRCWSTKTAPPSAKRRLLLVAATELQRGQQPLGDYFLADPLLIGLFIAAGVAIPVAIHNSKKNSASGS